MRASEGLFQACLITVKEVQGTQIVSAGQSEDMQAINWA